mgnify:CR=1 FL=1
MNWKNNIKKSDKRLLDKDWRISHLYKIKDKNKNLIRFQRNWAQIEFNKKKHTRNIILKSRQLGFTTEEVIDTLDDVLFIRNFDSLFIAQDLDTAKDIFDNKVNLAWDTFPLKDFYLINRNSARQLKFGFGGGQYSSITVDSSGRSGTFQRIHITEFAKLCRTFPDRAKEVIEGSIPAVPLGGRVDIESTADGSDGRFYEMFWESWEKKDFNLQSLEFKAHFFNWIYDEEIKNIVNIIKNLPNDFKDYQKQYNLSEKEITFYYLKWLSLNKDWSALRKEYPTTPFEAFQGSGNKLFDELGLSKLNIQPPIKQENEWNYYEEPKLGNKYCWGADVGEGIGQDHSTVVIWNLTNLKPKIVATYKNNRIAPDLFAFEIRNGGIKYQYAFGAVERNNHGHTTISKLREIYSEKLIYKDDKDKLGWQTNLVSKPKMMFDLNTAVNNELIDIPSQGIISEMRRYDKEDLRIKNYDEETEHYDLLTACAIGFQMKDYKVSENKPKVILPIYAGYNRLR